MTVQAARLVAGRGELLECVATLIESRPIVLITVGDQLLGDVERCCREELRRTVGPCGRCRVRLALAQIACVVADMHTPLGETDAPLEKLRATTPDNDQRR